EWPCPRALNKTEKCPSVSVSPRFPSDSLLVNCVGLDALFFWTTAKRSIRQPQRYKQAKALRPLPRRRPLMSGVQAHPLNRKRARRKLRQPTKPKEALAVPLQLSVEA